MTTAPSTSAILDLRSDTLTLPTPEMRQAMAQAEVGDDVMREDKTVAALEALVASTAGKEAGLYCPSGTMCNLIAVFVHMQLATQKGMLGPNEMIVGDRSHIFCYEAGGCSVCTSTLCVQLPNAADGTIPIERIEQHIRSSHSRDVHFGATKLVCLENTHNKCGGVVLPPSYCKEVRKLLDESFNGTVGLHLDGARLWNAAVKLQLSLSELAAPFDSVSLCLSKGLGAPVGSVLVGSTEFVNLARRFRKMLGGGMRQAGVIAAAGIYAVQNNVARLAQDHAIAARISAGLAAAGFEVLPVHTNIVIWRVKDASRLSDYTRIMREKYGVKASEIGHGLARVVPHLGCCGSSSSPSGENEMVERLLAACVGAWADATSAN